MAMVSVVFVAAYRRIWGSDQSVWSKGRQPPGASAALAKWTRWTLTVVVHCYNDSTTNIVAAVTITITQTDRQIVASRAAMINRLQLISRLLK